MAASDDASLADKLVSARYALKPSQENIDYHRSGMEALDTIRDNLPHIDEVQDFNGKAIDDNAGDYPYLASSECMSWDGTAMIWYTEFDGRALFCIDGVPYVRRYSDNWNSTVVEGELTDKAVSWIPGGIKRDELIALAKSFGETGDEKQ